MALELQEDDFAKLGETGDAVLLRTKSWYAFDRQIEGSKHTAELEPLAERQRSKMMELWDEYEWGTGRRRYQQASDEHEARREQVQSEVDALWSEYHRVADERCKTDITASCVADTVNMARHLFLPYLEKGLNPRFICYGNNAAPLAQAGAMLEDAEGRQPDIVAVPSAGYLVEKDNRFGLIYPLESSDNRSKYKELFHSINASPDDIVYGDASQPVIFVRPIGYTAKSFNGLDDFMEQWVNECAEQHFPDNRAEQEVYRQAFYDKSTLLAIRSRTWYGEDTKQIPPNEWTKNDSSEELFIPESVARSLRAMRAVSWVPTFMQYGKNDLSRTREGDGQKNEGYIENAALIVNAMAHYIAEGTETDWQSLSQLRDVSGAPGNEIEVAELQKRVNNQFRHGMGGGNEHYTNMMRGMGHEIDNEPLSGR